MEQYPAYKDSGIEWVGEIPSHWKRLRLKHLVAIKITDGPHETPEFLDSGVPFLSAEAIKENYLDFNYARGCISEDQYDVYRKKSEVKKHDVLLCKSGSTTGKSAIVETDRTFAIWSPLAIIRADLNKTTPYYIFHSLQSKGFRRQVELFWSFGTQPNIGMGAIENLWITNPPLPEQEAIASFLDRKTKLIDDLIAKKQRLIELKKEERAAIINQAVTKGLDPNVPLKDSGIEWLGEIPEHWVITKVAYLLKKGKDGIRIGPFGSSLRSDLLVEEGIKVYGQENVIKDNFSLGYRYISNIYFISDLNEYELIPGDLTVTMMGTTGKAKIIPDIEERGIMDSHLIRVRLESNLFIPQLLAIMINDSYALRNNMKVQSRGSIMEGLNSSIVKSLLIPVPPITEQQKILEYLSASMAMYDSSMKSVSEQIDLFKEYKTTLISEAVTGKIKVPQPV